MSRERSPSSPRPPRFAKAKAFLSKAVTVLGLAACSLGTVDCAGQRAPIDQRQPNALRKSFFVGDQLRNASDDPEFYVNNFVVDAPASQALVPVGTYDNVDRIRWEIQENVLLARKAYEFVANSDGHGVRGRTSSGLIVAAYRITSHFDIRPAYNPSTGEELNVLVENATDRPWYDREYFRVDWSENLVTNPDWDFIFYGQLFGELSFEPVRYYEQDPTHPNAPHLNEMYADANQGGGYFDVTSKWLVSPEMSYEFGFAFPTCMIMNFFSGSDTWDCNPQEATIRTSFRRIEDRDFEPLENTQQPYDLVGGPTAQRNGFDPGYGVTDGNFHRYRMIHNLWQQSHLRDGEGTRIECTSNADTNNDGTADACSTGAAAGHPGSQCDLVSRMCTIPYRERQIRPIVYYSNPDMPPEFQDHIEIEDANGLLHYRLPTAEERQGRTFMRQSSDVAGNGAFRTGATEELVASWNRAIMNAVGHAREAECRRTRAGDRAACHNMYFSQGQAATEDGAFLSDIPNAMNGPAVVLCHNPVNETDNPDACREVGYSVRLGDVRYNHVTYWNGNSRAPFGGIAHWGYDPLTGEVITNGAFNMGRSVEFAATQQRDFIRLIWSRMDPPQDDPALLSQYVSGDPASILAERIRNPAYGTSAMTEEEITNRIRSIDTEHAVSRQGASLPNVEDNVQRAMQLRQYAERRTLPTQSVSRTQLQLQARMRNVLGSTVESDMVDTNWLSHMGVDPGQPVTQEVINAVSPLRGLDPDAQASFTTRMMRRMEQRGYCMQDMSAPATIGSEDMQGVARWYIQRFPNLTPAQRAARVEQDLRVEAYKGIALHEIGHSLGLYHLPVSSYDSMNYTPQYWQLRTRNGQAGDTCRPGVSQNNPTAPSIRNPDRNMDNCMGPRYLDPESDEEMGIAPTQHAHAGINYFANTSTMEYQWDRFGETILMGAYDMYAMGVLYGRVMEVMDSSHHTVEDQQFFAPRLQTQLADQDRITWSDPSIVPQGQAFTLPIHYTELARHMRVFNPNQCRDATPAELERYKWRLVDGKICSFAPRDHVAMADMETSPPEPGDEAWPSWRVRPNSASDPRDASGATPIRWNYRVAWDIGTGYPHINYFDQGADIYEVTQAMIKKYELNYPVQYFRRGRREWAYWNISQSISGNIFRRIRGYHWSVTRDITFYAAVFNNRTFNQVVNDDNWLRPFAVTGPVIFDFFAGVMLRPEVGGFESNTDRLTPEMRGNTTTLFDAQDFPDPTAVDFNVGLINGRYVGQDYDNTFGGSWDYHHWVNRTGSYLEKPFAAIALTDTRPTFSSVTRDLFLDGREFQVNFFTDMPQAFDRLLGGILSEDWEAVAPHVNLNSNPADGELQPILPRLWQPTVARLDEAGQPIANPDNAGILFPNLGYQQYLPTIFYGMIFSSLNTDLNTVHKMRIYTEGGNEEVNIPAAEQIRFYNPETGINYVARRYGADPGYPASMVGTRTIDRGIASRMLAHANALAAAAYRTTGGNPDGTLIFARDSSGQLVPANADPDVQTRAVTQLRNYIGLIDQARNAANMIGYGIFGYGVDGL